MIVNVKFGVSVETRHYESGSNIGTVKHDADLKAVMGWGDSVRALVNGVEQPDAALLPEGGTVVIETRANSKAS